MTRYSNKSISELIKIAQRKFNRFIGIDPGVNTGVAVWCCDNKKFESIKTMSFWDCIEILETTLHKSLTDSNYCFKVILENPGINRPTFHWKVRDVKRRESISQRVGSNKRDAQLLAEYCQRYKIPIELIAPSKKGKIKANAFKNITRYEGSTSQHGRDAAMMVFQRK